MNYKSVSILIVLSICISPFLFSQNSDNVLSNITTAINQSDAAKLAEYFNTTIDLEAGTSDGSYSKKQAEMIMKDFFKNTPIKSFTSNHNGSSDDGSKYMIGTYKSTNNESFRVYILLKIVEDKLRINQIQFDKE